MRVADPIMDPPSRCGADQHFRVRSRKAPCHVPDCLARSFAVGPFSSSAANAILSSAIVGLPASRSLVALVLLEGPMTPQGAAACSNVCTASRNTTDELTTRASPEDTSFVEVIMSDPVEPLVLDLLEWIGAEPRPYSEVIEAWRTSCPRLPVWEEANARGFVERRHEPGSEALVLVSASGQAYLEAHRRAPRAEVAGFRSDPGATEYP